MLSSLYFDYCCTILKGFVPTAAKLWLERKEACILRPSVGVALSESDKRSWQMVRSLRLTFWAWHNVFMKLEEEIRLIFLTNRRAWWQEEVCNCWVWMKHKCISAHDWFVSENHHYCQRRQFLETFGAMFIYFLDTWLKSYKSKWFLD